MKNNKKVCISWSVVCCWCARRCWCVLKNEHITHLTKNEEGDMSELHMLTNTQSLPNDQTFEYTNDY